jgi:hypothetical protein
MYRASLIPALRPLTRPDRCRINKKNNRSGIPGVTKIDTWEHIRGGGITGGIGSRNGRSATARHKRRSFRSRGTVNKEPVSGRYEPDKTR